MHSSGDKVALPYMDVLDRTPRPASRDPKLKPNPTYSRTADKQANVHVLFRSGELYCWAAHPHSCEMLTARTM